MHRYVQNAHNKMKCVSGEQYVQCRDDSLQRGDILNLKQTIDRNE